MYGKACLIVFLAVGCSDSNTGTPDAGMVMLPPLSKKVNNMQMDADYSCNGHRMDPAGATAEFTVNGKVQDFQSKQAPSSTATVFVYEDLDHLLQNMPYSMVTDALDGTFTGLRIPPNHYRVNFKVVAPPDQIDTYEIGIPVPPNTTTMTRNSVSHFTANALPGLVGIDYDMTKSVIAGGVRDCAGDFVRGALISVDAGGPFMDANIFYFSDQDLPVRRTLQQFTNVDGLFTAINVPPVGMATITATGVIGSGPPQRVGRASIPLFAGALTIADVPPLAP